MGESRNLLGTTFHAWRDRISPADVGLSDAGRRRASGLRREELVALARLSVDYLVRLEQGRSTNPSAQIVESLSRALQLSTVERDHAYRLAGHVPPAARDISTHIPPGVQRMLSRMRDFPFAVFTADWTLITWTPLWTALLGDPLDIPDGHRNLVDAVFISRGVYGSRLRSERGDTLMESALVSDLRVAAAAHPHDSRLAELIARARSTSTRFAELWDSGAITSHASDRKTVSHPDVGDITLDCDILAVPGSDLRLVVYSAATGSVDADRLGFLAAVGTTYAPSAPVTRDVSALS